MRKLTDEERARRKLEIAQYQRDYRIHNAEQIAARRAAYRDRTRDAKAAADAAYYANNRERLLLKNAAYRHAHREQFAAYSRTHWEKNKDQRRAYVAEWYRNNPDARLRSTHRRRARIKGGGDLSRGVRAKLLKLQRGKCANCRVSLRRAGSQLDHIMPLARGGKNDDGNVQLLCPTCNNRKRASDPIDWARRNGRLL